MAMEVVSCTITPVLHARLLKLAEKTQLSKSDLVRRALENYLPESLDTPVAKE